MLKPLTQASGAFDLKATAIRAIKVHRKERMAMAIERSDSQTGRVNWD